MYDCVVCICTHFFWRDGPWRLSSPRGLSILDGRSGYIKMVQLLKFKKKKLQTTRTVELLPFTVGDTEAQGELEERKRNLPKVTDEVVAAPALAPKDPKHPVQDLCRLSLIPLLRLI